MRDTESPQAGDPYWVTHFDAIYADLEERLSHSIVVRREHTFLPEIRAAADGLFYPALSAPLGPDHDYSCPPDHVEYLREWLGRLDFVNVLLVGYSGYDEAIGRLIRESGKPVATLAVLNQSLDASRATAARLAEQLHQTIDPTALADAGFGPAVRTGGLLDQFLSNVE